MIEIALDYLGEYQLEAIGTAIFIGLIGCLWLAWDFRFNYKWKKAYNRYIKSLNLKRLRRETGRNDKCYCGSGKKYKKCCLNKK